MRLIVISDEGFNGCLVLMDEKIIWVEWGCVCEGKGLIVDFISILQYVITETYFRMRMLRICMRKILGGGDLRNDCDKT